MAINLSLVLSKSTLCVRANYSLIRGVGSWALGTFFPLFSFRGSLRLLVFFLRVYVPCLDKLGWRSFFLNSLKELCAHFEHNLLWNIAQFWVVKFVVDLFFAVWSYSLQWLSCDGVVLCTILLDLGGQIIGVTLVTTLIFLAHTPLAQALCIHVYNRHY